MYIYSISVLLPTNPFDIRREDVVEAANRLRRYLLQQRDDPHTHTHTHTHSLFRSFSSIVNSVHHLHDGADTNRNRRRRRRTRDQSYDKHSVPIATMGNFMEKIMKHPILRDPFSDEVCVCVCVCMCVCVCVCCVCLFVCVCFYFVVFCVLLLI